MHDERSEECIIHEPIVHHELTDLIHGQVYSFWKQMSLTVYSCFVE